MKKFLALYPFHRGRGRLALSRRFRRSTQTSLECLNTRQAIYVFSDDYIGRMVQLFGEFDRAMIRFVESVVSEGDAVVDIGSNIGVMTLPLSRLVGENGFVYAFDPQKKVCELLLRSVQANGISNVELMNIGLSHAEGTLHLQSSSSNLGGAKLVEQAPGTEACKVCTLDALDDAGLFSGVTNGIKLLKIDVEGHEANVFRGGGEFFRRYTPQYVLFESHKNGTTVNMKEEFHFLRQRNYVIFEIVNSAFHGYRLIRVPAREEYDPKGFDFVGIQASDQGHIA